MSSIRVNGGKKLSGEITPQGAKNEALQVICATLLTDSDVVISNIPNIIGKILLIMSFSRIHIILYICNLIFVNYLCCR